MELLDKKLLEITEELIKNSDRKNIGSSRYWYPLNYATFGAEEITSAIQSMLTFRTSMSEKCKLFENLFKNYIDSSEAIFVNSGSSADLLAISAITKSPDFDLKKGDKVLVPAITWPTQVWAIIQSGLIPVLYDCSITSFNPDITTVPKEILMECKAIFATHILGTCCDIDELMNICADFNLYLLEDACESLGTKYKGKQVGTFGEIGTFSFFFSHHITTMEGGMLCTNNNDLKDQSKIMRAHGWSRSIQEDGLEDFCKKRDISLLDYKEIDTRYLFLDEGYNLRPTEINASFGIQQLSKIKQFNNHRIELSKEFYNSLGELKNISGPIIDKNCSPCFMALPFTLNTENFKAYDAIKFLEERGIESRPLIAGNLHRHPVQKIMKLEKAFDNLSGADYHHHKSLYVGLTPKHTMEDISRLIKILQELDKLVV
ncbi:DegT/DnrJ/EryC1/StrS family aminotransferase [Prochlorococcus sp. AH-716-P05]|nr:DegT/DnrJ/EryC1/StrS family aminotransferase [Prochlorococcus sp. AH-716-P05]